MSVDYHTRETRAAKRGRAAFDYAPFDYAQGEQDSQGKHDWEATPTHALPNGRWRYPSVTERNNSGAFPAFRLEWTGAWLTV